ncbi:MAG: OmpA family protein [Burkholderiaceae bacterium]
MNTNKRTIPMACALALTLTVGACATTPAPNMALQQAREAHDRLTAMPAARQMAGVEVAEADKALERAQAAWRSDRDSTRVDHLATLAERRAQIAQAVAQRRMAEARIAQGSDTRNQLMLQSRERAAMQAQAQKQMAQRENSVLRAKVARSESELAQVQQQLAALAAKPTDRGMVVTLEGVLFESGSSVLKPGANRKLGQLAEVLQDNPERTVVIEGFTHAQGDEQSNLALSQRRADAVKIDLIRKGISADRLQTQGLGEAYPVASNDTAAGRQQNRRVELIISDEDGLVNERRS